MDRTTERAAIRAIIESYIAGTAERDVAGLRSVFHENAIMAGYLGPNKLIGSPEPFFAHVAATPHAGPYTAEISKLSVVGRTATAELMERGLYGMDFVNDFHLLKDANGWAITAKLFHHD